LGTTIHIATEKVDDGDILYIVKPDIKDKDHYYDITNKLIKKSIKKFSDVVYSYDNGNIEKIPQDISKQKYFYKKKDFSEECLKKVLDEFWSESVISS
jgi:methionyl-tRNA formyltransferase